MATLDDAARVALALPEVTEVERHGGRAWTIGGKVFAWERSFSKADIKRYGDTTPPADPILAVRVGDLGEKEAVLSAGHAGFFTIPHFDNYAAILVELAEASEADLREALTDAWLAVAPPAVARAFVADDA